MKRRNKYNARKVVVDGLEFDSAGEAARWQELKFMEGCGEIRNLTRQNRFVVKVNGEKVFSYVADFVYDELTADGVVRRIEDYKGYRTPLFNLKAKVFKAATGQDIILQDGLPATARRARKRK